MKMKRRQPAYRALPPAAACLLFGYVSAWPHLPSRPSASASAAANEALAFERVTVVDVTSGRLLADRTVLITGNRVRAVGPTTQVRLPPKTRRIDAKGRYLIPGLWDMHAHTEFPTLPESVQDTLYPKNYRSYIANGVTGLREMAQRFPNGTAFFRNQQTRVMAGTEVGPRAVGPSADLTYELELKTPDDAKRIMDSLKTAGTAFIKFHDVIMSRQLFFAVAREARRVGLPLVGHVPRSVTNVEAADSGLHSVEHANEIFQCWPNFPGVLDSVMAEESCRPVAAAYLRDSTWITPTLVIEIATRRDDEAYVQSLRMLLRTLHRLGVKNILAGTDCAEEVLQSWGLDEACHRGLSLLQEIVLLSEAGLTPLEALQAATLKPAQYFKATDSLGTVAPGKLADLVLLDANPLADIRNVRKIRAVVANGHYFDRATLDTMDTVSTRLAKGYSDTTFTRGGVQQGRLGIGMKFGNADDVTTAGPQRTAGVVDSVRPNSPAQAAGIAVGDSIITIDGKSIGSAQQLQTLRATWKVGQTVTIEIARKDGAHRIVNVKLGE